MERLNALFVLENVPAAVAAGATLVKHVTRALWGVAGFLKGPDGYLFEVDYECKWVFDAVGSLSGDSLRFWRSTNFSRERDPGP